MKCPGPRQLVAQLSALALSLLLVVSCQNRGAPSPARTPSAADDLPALAQETGSIKARGIVRPAQTLELSFGAGGTVSSVVAEVGTSVSAGDVLAELDETVLEFEVKKTRESILLRRAELNALLNGPNPALLERAEAEHDQQVAEAEMAVQVAQLRVDEARIQEQDRQEAHQGAVRSAEAKLKELDLQLAQAREQSPDAELTSAQVNVARARDTMQTAQVEYDKAIHRYWEPQEVRDAYAKALWHAEQELVLAQAQLSSATDAQNAHALGLELLAAQRDAAAKELTQTLESRVVFTTTLALLEAEVERARLGLSGLRTWQNPYQDPPAEDAITEARVALRQAELAVEELEWQLQGAQLRAPFDGAVSAVHLSPGEWAGAGAPVIELVDTSGWRVETRNVGELDIGGVRVGQEALVQVNAFPRETLRGRVVTISPVAVVQQGDTTYTLMIELEPTGLDLRPGMTAQVEILTPAD